MTAGSDDVRPKVICWFTIPSPYIVERLNALAERGVLDLEVWFNARTRKFRAWNVDETGWRFKYRYLKTFSLFGMDFGWPPLLGKSVSPDLLLAYYSEPVFLLGLFMARMRGFKTILYVEKAARIWSPRRWWKELLKSLIFRRVDGLAHIGEETRKYAEQYSGAGQRFYYLPHVVDVDHFAKAAEMLPEERGRIRERLSLRGLTFLYVGRLLRLKGLDCLLEAFGMLQKELADEASLMLVGDGEYEEALRLAIRTKGLRNVFLPGFVQKEKLTEYYAAGDVFVLPTRGDVYGLVVDEAFAAGLPVICSSATGEIRSRIEDEVSGFIVPPEDPWALFAKMKELALSAELRASMGKKGSEWVRGRNPVAWAGNFEEMARSILAEGDSAGDA